MLQEAIAARGRGTFEELLQRRVIAPLGLQSTAITLTSQLHVRAATGHYVVLQPAPPFASVPVFNLMPAAGGMASTANDLLRFLSVAMGYEDSKLAHSMAKLLQTRRPAGSAEQALGWLITGTGDDAIVYHDGGSFGHASSVPWQPQRRIGVVVLANPNSTMSATSRGICCSRAFRSNSRRALVTRRSRSTLPFSTSTSVAMTCKRKVSSSSLATVPC